MGSSTKAAARTHGYGATREEALQSLARSWHMRKGPGDIPEPEASRVRVGAKEG